MTSARHEAADWIGVVQTPSAFLQHRDREDSHWCMHRAPMKGGAIEIPCVDWPRVWRESERGEDDLREQFATMGPFDTAIAAKYLNTLAFFKARQKERAL